MDIEAVRDEFRGRGSSGQRDLRLAVLLWMIGVSAAAAVSAQGVNEFPLPPDRLPYDIAVGSDGALWFTEIDRIGRITTAGVITDYPLGSFALPEGIVSGPDGNLWFVESSKGDVGRLTTAGVLTEFSASGNPQGITTGPDGALWFTESSANKIGRITTDGTITTYPLPVNSGPYGIVTGPDSALWFTELYADKIGRMMTDGTFTEYPTPSSNAGLYGIVAGPDGNLWFNESGASKIGQITTAGVITEFALPTTTRNFDITVGPDGNLWFTEFDNNKIGRMTTTGAVDEFLIPTADCGALGITTGPDGNIWFTEWKASKIGRVNGSFWPAGLSVDAAAAPGSSSNANGVLEPGETVLVVPSWTNETTSPVSVTGAASDPSGPIGATYGLPDASADYGTIPAATVGDCGSDCYLFSLSNPATRPKAHWDAIFTETLSNTARKTWVLHVGSSFADVPNSDAFYPFIETIFHRGVTAGCSNGNYCPADPVTRAQMAVFLLTAEHGSSYVPPACTGIFQDVPCPGGFAVDWVEELYNKGITAGCGNGDYCPADPVTRAQMAVFLLTAEHGPGYTPPACSGIFQDVACPGGFAADWIEQLYNEGITAGCLASPPLYCPDDPNTRGQMAVFLTKTFGLRLYGP